MPSDHLRDILAGLGQLMGLSALEPDEEGYCVFQVDDHFLTLLAYPKGEALCLLSGLGSLHPANEADVLPLLLEANFLWKGTSGCTLSIDPRERTVFLAYRYEVRPDAEATHLARALEAFLDTADVWRERLLSWGAGSAAHPSAPPAPGSIKI